MAVIIEMSAVINSLRRNPTFCHRKYLVNGRDEVRETTEHSTNRYNKLDALAIHSTFLKASGSEE